MMISKVFGKKTCSLFVESLSKINKTNFLGKNYFFPSIINKGSIKRSFKFLDQTKIVLFCLCLIFVLLIFILLKFYKKDIGSSILYKNLMALNEILSKLKLELALKPFSKETVNHIKDIFNNKDKKHSFEHIHSQSCFSYEDNVISDDNFINLVGSLRRIRTYTSSCFECNCEELCIDCNLFLNFSENECRYLIEQVENRLR